MKKNKNVNPSEKKKLKDILKPIKTFFKFIYKILDKILITPISKFVYYITDKLGNNSGAFERFLNKPGTLIYISLICAVVCFLVIDNKAVNLVSKESVVLTNQTVTANYNEEAYVVEGIPDSAEIILMGRKSDLYLAEQLADHKLTLDLSDLSEGTHKVKLKYNNPINSLEYKLDPSSVTVIIYPKKSEYRTLTKDIINTDKLKDVLVVSSVILDKDEVIIKSYEEKLDKVASVKAIIDAMATNATVAGTYTLENVKLVAYDENGTEIPDIEIVPGQVTATITITSPSKEVPIKIIPTGEVKSGSAINTITSDVNKVILYGDEEALKSIEELEVNIDVSDLSEDKSYQIDIPKPSNVRAMSETKMNVKVTMEKETSKEFEDIQIEMVNLKSGFKALGASEDDVKINVVVKGVSSLLEKLDKNSIKAYVDLSNVSAPGTLNVAVSVTGDDLRLQYTSKVKTVSIIIEYE